MGTYDALLVVSFGGPEGHDDVMPFLENVTRGRGVPRERLLKVAEHYYAFGGVSPINQHCRDLIAALKQVVDLPIYWGNRNWSPFLAETVEQMRADGVRKAAAFITSAYRSYSSCRQYLDDIALARQAVPGAPEIVRLRHYYDHPGFIAAMADHTREALSKAPGARLVFTAHSIPVTMADTAGPSGGAYEAGLRTASALVTEAVGRDGFDLVWQSRSGPPQVPWLAPDVNDHLRALHAEGVGSVVLVPIGFVSDHMEVVHDLDVEAAETAAELGMTLARATTASVHPRFVSMVAELLAEPEPFRCHADCCPRPARVPAAPPGQDG
ncbi:ferrochelatase [Streptosporangiaceae bacterium NEAU-GS5]|nr:ferrochelatase [Streptosporangiaceae bacterium NEAU-GS5]